MRRIRQTGFTLIEISVVLVIIGLIAGGIFVGQSVVEGDKIRSQLSQIDKYKAAVNTFETKYGVLPGDATPAQAAQFGFIARSGGLGNGDNDKHVKWFGWQPAWPPVLGGETVLFWTDLSSAGLIAESFSDSTDVVIIGSSDGSIPPVIDFSKYVPRPKVGQGGFIFAFDNPSTSNNHVGGIPNYSGLVFEISSPTSTNNVDITVINGPLSISQAIAIDIKIDDGAPLTGKVVAALPSTNLGIPGSVGSLDTLRNAEPGFCVAGTNWNLNLSGNMIGCDLMIADD